MKKKNEGDRNKEEIEDEEIRGMEEREDKEEEGRKAPSNSGSTEYSYEIYKMFIIIIRIFYKYLPKYFINVFVIFVISGYSYLKNLYSEIVYLFLI